MPEPNLVPSNFIRTPDEENLEKWLQDLSTETFTATHNAVQANYHSTFKEASYLGRRLALYRAEESRRAVQVVRDEVAKQDG